MLHLAPYISKEDDREERKRGERSWSGGCLGGGEVAESVGEGGVLSLSANKRVSK